MKTSELTGAALDWVVAKCEGDVSLEHFLAMHGNYAHDSGTFDYSTDWAQGGPIIEREKIGIEFDGKDGWGATKREWFPNIEADGPSPLIAAMRCYVASKLGAEVEIPEVLG